MTSQQTSDFQAAAALYREAKARIAELKQRLRTVNEMLEVACLVQSESAMVLRDTMRAVVADAGVSREDSLDHGVSFTVL